MKISELIEKLQEFKKEYGDIECRIKHISDTECYGGESTIKDFEYEEYYEVYADDGTFINRKYIFFNGWEC